MPRNKIVPTGPTTDRSKTLGASDIGAVAGMNPYRHPIDVWGDKVGLGEHVECEAMAIGSALERPVLRLWAEREGMRLRFPGTLSPSGYRFRDAPWSSATPDAIVIKGRTRRVAEVKCVGYRAAQRWGEETMGAEGIPPEVFCQVQWQLMVTNLANAIVLALLGTELRVYPITRDEGAIIDLLKIGKDFWERFVIPKVMPPPGGSDNARAIIERRFPRPKIPR